MSTTLDEGLRRIDELGALDHYHLFHAARADLLRRVGRAAEAADAYERAILLATNPVESAFLRSRLDGLNKEKLK